MNRMIIFVSLILCFLSACSDEKEEAVVTAISLDQSALTLKVGEEYQFKVSHTPQDAKTPGYSWGVTDTTLSVKIASIDQTGFFKAEKAGITTVRVTTTDVLTEDLYPLVSTCKVTIEPAEVEGIQLNKSEITLKAGETETLTYTLTPTQVTNPEVEWSSSNSGIVDVTDGVITAKDIGEAEITVTIKNTTIRSSCKVIVEPTPLEGIEIKEDNIEVFVGEQIDIPVLFIPENATKQKINWISSHTHIVSISEEGIPVAVGIGPSLLTAVTEDGRFHASCRVLVKQIPVERIEFEQAVYTLEVGEIVKPEVIFYPENAGNKNYTLTSSHPTVVGIDHRYYVQALARGHDATITARSEDGSKIASCVVRVRAK